MTLQRGQGKAGQIAIAVLVAIAASARVYAAAPAPTVVGISMDDYRKHLTALVDVTANCAKGRDKQSCDPESIGADDNIKLGNTTRVIRYDWLRALFLRAQKPDAVKHNDSVDPEIAANEASLPAPKTTTELLNSAQARLTNDLAQAGAQLQSEPQHPAESSAMRKVLSEREFRKLTQHSATDSIAEKINEWLNKLFNGLSQLTAGAAWLGQLLVWGFVLVVAAGLAWGLLQLERRWRVRLVPDSDGPAPGAASARDWQLWLSDAHKAAEAGQWREAIHFLYWAAISRLESKRLWPADRARTPREYLALVAPEDPRKAGLAALTGSFERTWYGGRPAAEADYKQADALAASLIGAAPATPTVANGGAQ